MSNEKLLLLGNYKPPSQNYLSFISEIKLAWNVFSFSYQSFNLSDSFNLTRENPNSNNSLLSASSKIRQATNHIIHIINKSYHPPICTDFNISKCRKLQFWNQLPLALSVWFSQFESTIRQKTISKGDVKKIFWRDYKPF